MDIKIEVNTKELDILSNKSEETITCNFIIDLYTESRTSITPKEETAILSGLLWALCTMLPSTIIQLVFKRWSDLVTELNEGLAKGNKVMLKQIEEEK